MILIYDLVILLYVFAIRMSALSGNAKAKLWVEGRAEWRKKLSEALVPGEKRVWFHCSSLGEFEQGRPVMEKLKAASGEKKIVLSFFSPSGYEVRKNYSGADYVFYLPPDTAGNASDFISLIQPEEVFFTKYEYWHHFFHVLKEKNIPLYMISAVFRPQDRFFRWYGNFFRDMLKCVTHFFVQDEQSKSLLADIGFGNCTLAGDTRFDRVIEVSSNAKEIPLMKKFSEGKNVLVAGSTWNADEKILEEILKSFRGKLKLVIAPHEISEEKIEHVFEMFASFNVVAFSKAEHAGFESMDVLVIDNIGMLSSLYRYGKFAFIGGGFGAGIHNTLEAAVYGVPVFFGPNYSKFNEAKALIECGGAFSVADAEALRAIVSRLLADEKERQQSGKAAGNYVLSNSGATERILGMLSKPGT